VLVPTRNWPAYALLFTWLAGLSAPAILAQYGWVTKRALGALPALMMLAAVGCLGVWEWVSGAGGRGPRKWSVVRRGVSRLGVSRLGVAWLIGAGLAYSAAQTTRGYFHVWAEDPDLFTHFEVGPAEMGLAIGSLPPGERVYLSPTPVDHPTVMLYSGRRPGVQGYQGRFCTVAVDRAPHDTTYLIAHHDDKQSLPRLAALYPKSQAVGQGALHYGQPFYSAVRVPAGTAPAVMPQVEREVDWAAPEARIQLAGYDLDQATYRPGEHITLTAYWRANGTLAKDYSVFVHLLGPGDAATSGPPWAQDDSEPCRRGYPTSAWAAHEIVIDPYALAIPQDAPAGEYRIAIGLYEWQTMTRLPVLDEAGNVAGDYTILGSVRVEAAP
jgi:hypothetical protein